MKYSLEKHNICFIICVLILINMIAGCAKEPENYSSDSPMISFNSFSDSRSAASSVGETSSTFSSGNDVKSSSINSITISSTVVSLAPTKSAAATTQILPSSVKSSEIGFGMYGVQPNDGITPEFQNLMESNYVNNFIIDGNIESIKETVKYAKTNNSKFWTTIPGLYGIAGLSDNWKIRIDDVVSNIGLSNATNQWQGFYFDEPMLWGVTNNEMLTITKYMKDKTNKRIFVCFSIACFYQDKWKPTDKVVQEITPEGGKYLTDVAYDVYEPFVSSNFEQYSAKLKEKLGRDDFKMWYVPCIMSYRGTSNEEYAQKHLNGCFDLLKKEKNPGGIMGYIYRAFTSGDDAEIGNKGFVDFAAQWLGLDRDIKRIGKSICTKEAFGR